MTCSLNLYTHAKRTGSWWEKNSSSILSLSEKLNSSSQFKQKEIHMTRGRGQRNKGVANKYLQSPDSSTKLLEGWDRFWKCHSIQDTEQLKTHKVLLCFLTCSKAKILYLRNYVTKINAAFLYFPKIFFLLISFHLFCHFYCIHISRNKV